jgi:alkylhydroperoxidase family enzyme
VETRYDGHIAALHAAALPGREAPPEFGDYLRKVRLHAYKVVDRDLDELKAADFSEDEIFEHTVSVAVEAGLDRLDAALRVLE